MWHMKVLAVSVVVLGALLFGAVVAYAGWGWNAKVDIEGTRISTSWSVDDVTGAKDYHAEITITVPEGTDTNVVKVAPTEHVTIVDDVEGVTCNDATVTYVVTGASDGVVSVSVDRVGGGNGERNYGTAAGGIGDTLSVSIAALCNG
ncbi:MAG: hypothetical protein HQ475_13485 [SAR202 cluster bacterium]|nr:hypothetical protein [SAR202 cluster bacterium]